ncbi:hypothetical protein YB2330_000138 [Saitoella coloradoensis]
MGPVTGRGKSHSKTAKYAKSTIRMGRMLDQIHDDINDPDAKLKLDEKLGKLDEELPGLGQFYCKPCAKYFETEHADVEHRRGKNHKKRVKLLKETPYSQAEAEAGVGLGVVTLQKKRAAQAAQKLSAVAEVKDAMQE